MKNTQILAVICALAFPATAFGGTAHPKVAPAATVRQIPQSSYARVTGLIVRQDLFDRNNPNNLRPDWHGPPAQPGQF
jgi:hypothetical protein